MKKTIILLLTLICALLGVACSGDNNDNANNGTPQTPVHVCEWETTYTYDATRHYFKCKDQDCSKISQVEEHEYTLQGEDYSPTQTPINQCVCGNSYDVNVVSIMPYGAQTTLDKMEDCTVVKMKRGEYNTIKIADKNNIILYASEPVTVQLLIIAGNCKNIYVHNIEFDSIFNAESWEGGVKVQNGNNVENLVVKNCSFTNNCGIINDTSTRLTNAKVIDCKFSNVQYCSMEAYRSAIVAYYCYGLTVEGCEFDGIMKNCVQAYVSGGSDLVIKDNVFKNSGGVVLNIWVYSIQSDVEISANVFCMEKCSTNPNVDIARDEGVYIYSGKENVAVGANTWEVMPEKTDFYLYNVSIDMSAQKLLNGN